MTAEEVFKTISAHMIKGIMFHEQMADYFDFLSLKGYKRCHEYHGVCEAREFRRLHRYYISRYGKLIQDENVGNPEVIPESWYRHERADVDAATVSTAVKSGIEKWVEWESETKTLYESAYCDLIDAGEVAAAGKLWKFIEGVDGELKRAEQKRLELEAVKYNTEYILAEQKEMHDRFKRAMRW